MKRIAVLAFLTFLCFNTPMAAQSRIFDLPKATVWSAMMESLTASNIHPQSMDSGSGTVFFQTEASWTTYWGGLNQAVALMTSKRVSWASTWQVLLVSGNLYCKEL